MLYIPIENMPATTTTQKLKTKDIDDIIGRPHFSFKEEILNLQKFYSFSAFEPFVTEVLTKGDITFLKNDIVRTWNLLLKVSNKVTNIKKISYKDLNLTNTETGLPLASQEKLQDAYDNIYVILCMFIPSKYFSLKVYDNGFLLWMEPNIEKHVTKVISPIYYSHVQYYGIKDVRGGIPVYNSTSYRNNENYWRRDYTESGSRTKDDKSSKKKKKKKKKKKDKDKNTESSSSSTSESTSIVSVHRTKDILLSVDSLGWETWQMPSGRTYRTFKPQKDITTRHPSLPTLGSMFQGVKDYLSSNQGNDILNFYINHSISGVKKVFTVSKSLYPHILRIDVSTIESIISNWIDINKGWIARTIAPEAVIQTHLARVCAETESDNIDIINRVNTSINKNQRIIS